jgi:cellulose synthase/poly-beta-1,6-N-acetylglucosamine synthase-like glycosyltransferase
MNQDSYSSITLIVSVYRNIENLRVILGALENQSYKNFEVIVSEDGNSQEMQHFVERYETDLSIRHITQIDEGWQKNKALNNAIKNSNGEYLIFIDGDCVPHFKFVEEHIKNADGKKILMGTRVELNERYSNLLKKEGMVLFSKNYLKRIVFMAANKMKFVGKGIYINSNGFFKFILFKNRKSKSLIGCNMSFYKNAILELNGFDEDYILPAAGEDDDLVWRFEALGYTFKSVKNLAIQYHLYHEKNWSDSSINVAIMLKKQREKNYFCLNGITKSTIE